MPSTLYRVLSDIVMAEVKRPDAPCSADTHINRAIVELSALCPEWKPSCDESREVVEFAHKEIALLRPPLPDQPLPPIAARVQSDLLRHPDEASQRLAAMVEERARFGLKKYGVGLSCDTDFGDKPPQQYAIEEWLDAAHYSLVCAKRGLAPGVGFWQRAYSDSLQLARLAMAGVVEP